jgi:hypothetical protein
VIITEHAWGTDIAIKSEQPTDEELEVAIVDAECKVRVAFWYAVDAAEDEAAKGVMESAFPLIEELQQANAKLAENVAQIAAAL